MHDLMIQAATASEARDIAEIHVRGWRWAYRGLLPDALLAELSVDRRTTYWRQWADESAPGRHLWLARRGTRPVGFAATGPSRDGDAARDIGELYAIYLELDVAGTGVGRALDAHAMAAMAAVGFSRATLWVLAGNARARRFYERVGWRADGAERAEDWNGFPFDEVRYARDLVAPGPGEAP